MKGYAYTRGLHRLLLLGLLAMLAACRVRGVITYQGAPLAGLVVVAKSGSQVAGYAVTDAKGNYEIDVGDTRSVTVAPLSSGYTFAPSSRSVTFRSTDDDVRVDFEAVTKKPFRPSTHGFHFTNAWNITSSNYRDMQFPGDDSTETAPYKEFAMAVNPVGSTMGLCGGMSTLARDFYVAGLPMPSRTTAPYPSLFDGQSNELYAAIWYRLFDTWGGDEVFPVYDKVMQDMGDGTLDPNNYAPDHTDLEKMLYWMVEYPVDGPGGLHEKTRAELDELTQRVDDGELVDLYLMLRHDVAQGWSFDYLSTQVGHNHQVLVYAYARSAEALSLHVYDPNYPSDDEQRIEVGLDAQGNVTSIEGSYTIFGLFLGKHVLTPQPPSEALIKQLGH